MTELNDEGKVTRSGYSPRSSQYQLLWSLIWQLGGDFFDKESGIWAHDSEVGEAAAQIIHDIYWVHKTCDFELFTNEFEAVSQQLVSIWGDGAWTMSVQTDVAEVPADNIVKAAAWPTLSSMRSTRSMWPVGGFPNGWRMTLPSWTPASLFPC